MTDAEINNDRRVTGRASCATRSALPMRSEKVAGDERNVILEIGPGQTLGPLVRQHPAKAAKLKIFPSLAATSERGRDLDTMLASLGGLWSAGAKSDWAAFYRDEKRRRLPLPTYPFERKRFWVEPSASVSQERELRTDTG